MNRHLWIFGYGSLLWRPDFDYLETRPCFIKGWARRFWQGSIDHRGVPEAPGRVVTLVPDAQALCWGRCYKIAADSHTSVLARLDHREKGGYERHFASLHFTGAPDCAVTAERATDCSTGDEPNAGELQAGDERGLFYLASPNNRNYLGEAPLSEIAGQIAAATGPSGANREYAECLAAELRALGAEDEHVFAVERLLDGLRDPGSARVSADRQTPP